MEERNCGLRMDIGVNDVPVKKFLIAQALSAGPELTFAPVTAWACCMEVESKVIIGVDVEVELHLGNQESNTANPTAGAEWVTSKPAGRPTAEADALLWALQGSSGPGGEVYSRVPASR